MTRPTIKIGGTSGYWGDASHATGQLLAGAMLENPVYDYLAKNTVTDLLGGGGTASLRHVTQDKDYAQTPLPKSLLEEL